MCECGVSLAPLGLTRSPCIEPSSISTEQTFGTDVELVSVDKAKVKTIGVEFGFTNKSTLGTQWRLVPIQLPPPKQTRPLSLFLRDVFSRFHLPDVWISQVGPYQHWPTHLLPCARGFDQRAQDRARHSDVRPARHPELPNSLWDYGRANAVLKKTIHRGKKQRTKKRGNIPRQSMNTGPA